MDCKWPLVCDRRIFPFYCNYSYDDTFGDNLKNNVRREMQQGGKVSIFFLDICMFILSPLHH